MFHSKGCQIVVSLSLCRSFTNRLETSSTQVISQQYSKPGGGAATLWAPDENIVYCIYLFWSDQHFLYLLWVISPIHSRQSLASITQRFPPQGIITNLHFISRILRKYNFSLHNIGTKDFIKNFSKIVANISPKILADEFGSTESTIKLILEALQRPFDYDLRNENNLKPIFRSGVTSLSDLQVNMVVNGNNKESFLQVTGSQPF